VFQFSLSQKQWSWDRPLKRFSNLRHLQLLIRYFHYEVDKLLYSSVSFLRAAPFIEKLEVHVSPIHVNYIIYIYIYIFRNFTIY